MLAGLNGRARARTKTAVNGNVVTETAQALLHRFHGVSRGALTQKRTWTGGGLADRSTNRDAHFRLRRTAIALAQNQLGAIVILDAIRQTVVAAVDAFGDSANVAVCRRAR